MARVLFLCMGNAARSQMAEGFCAARGEVGVDIASAGIDPTAVHPLAVRVMREAGIDISTQAAKPLSAVLDREFDVAVLLCEEASAQCPILPGNPPRVRWKVANPDVPGLSEDGLLAKFRACRDEIAGLVRDLFARGYLGAFVDARACRDLILDNLAEGIIAHGLDRRIFAFNRAAERITGYKARDVMNKDCHEVFPDGFCGGKCLFADGMPPTFEVRRYDVDIGTRAGERKRVAMSLRAMTDGENRRVGVIGTFRDITREFDLARRLGEVNQFAGIIGHDKKMIEIFDLIREVADTNVPVMIQGESGTGKELVAAAIHNEGRRARKLFVPVNCGALPESLLESELFGHVRGAFTGAVRDKKGRFELADGGTVFLDEIGDISPAMQVKLLRVLQEGRFERVGGEHTLQVDVRVISATNRDISAEIREGRFREDLFYRLSVVPVVLPPLRERRMDIPLLAEHVLKRVSEGAGRPGVRFSPDVMDIMMSYDWPGNVRELENWIQFSLVKCKNAMILPEHLPPLLRSRLPPVVVRPRRRRGLDEDAVRRALKETGGNKVDAARILGVSRATLYRFLGEV